MTRKIFTIIFVILLVPTLFAATAVTAVRAIVLNPKTIANALEKSDFYNQATPIAAELLATELQKQALAALPDAAKKEFDNLIRKVLPPEWLKTQTVAVLQEVENYLAGKNQTITLVLPLADVRERVRAVTKNQSLAPMIPDRFDVGALIMQNKNMLDEARIFIALSKQIQDGLWVLSAIFMLTIILINLKHLAWLSAALGFGLLFASIPIFATAATFSLALPGFLRTNLPFDFSAETATAITNVLQTFLGQLLQNAWYAGAWLLAIAVVLFVLSWFLSPRRNKQSV